MNGRVKQRCLVALGLLVLLGLPAPAYLAPTPGGARVGAWNIEWLGTPTSRSGPGKDVLQKHQDIGAYIQASKVDVLGLEEITDTDTDPVARRNRVLDRAFTRIRNQSGQDWKYKLFPKPGGENTQLVGLAWNEDQVDLVQGPSPVNVTPGGSVWRRLPYAAKFSFGSGRSDVVVIVLHLKSNSDGETAGRDARRREATQLVDQLDEVKSTFDDQDIILMGDVNTLDTDDPGTRVFRQAGFRDLNPDDETTYRKGSYRSPFDRIFVPTGQSEFTATRQQVFDAEFMTPRAWSITNFTKRLSDHYMVLTDVAVRTDDD